MYPHEESFFQIAFSVTLVVFGFRNNRLSLLLRKQPMQPFEGNWCLPGKLVDPAESLNDATMDVLSNTLGHTGLYTEQLNAFGGLHRHPSGRVIDIAIMGLMPFTDEDEAGEITGSYECRWIDFNDIPAMAFDHNEIADFAIQRLKRRFTKRPIAFSMLPESFTLNQLQDLYESVLGKTMDKRNFRRKLKQLDVLEQREKIQSNKTGRKSFLYAYNGADKSFDAVSF